MGCRLVLLTLLGLMAFGYAAKCPKQRTSPGREILCYTTTNDIELLEESICRCTSIVQQGHDLKDLSTSGIKEFQRSLKEINPTIQVLLSVSDSDGSLKTSARVRQEAAARIVRVLNEVDGIELNVTAGTKERLVHFVQGLKTEMVRKSKDKRILLVLPTRPEDLAKQFDLKALSKYVDLFTLPTHHLVDDDEAFRTFHPSRLMGLFDMLNTDSLVDLVNGLGLEKRKILVSLPASVYKFTLENNDENAPRAPAKGKLPVKISRSEMCESMDKGEWVVERDEDLTAPYAFKDDTWIAFEDKISVGIKGKYVLLRDLAGLGIHDVEMDKKSKCEDSLTEDVYHAFTDNKRKTREAVLSSLQEDLQQTQGPYSGHIKSSAYRIVRVVDTDGHIHAMRENTKTEFSCPRQGYFVHPKSCNRFYRCVKFNQGIDDYSVFEFDCPAGLAFDETTEVCVWPGSITACSGSSEIAPSKGAKFTCPDHPGYYADPHNCRSFYACYDLGEHEMTAYEFRCPYGLVFDEHKLVCEWPYLVPGCSGEVYERREYGDGGHGGSSGGEHGGADHGGHGGYDGGDDDGHGGYDGGNHDGGYGGDHDGGHGVPSQGGHGGEHQGGHGGSDNGGHGESGGHHEGGHGVPTQGGHGGEHQGGHGGSDHGGHGGSDQDQHGGADEGKHGAHGEVGHDGHGRAEHEGHEEHGGADEGQHGGAGQTGHGGHGGADQDTHGGGNQGGHGEAGHGGNGGFGGGYEGGHDTSGQGDHGEGHQGEHGGSDQGSHGGSEHGRGREEGQDGHGGHGGAGAGGHGEHGIVVQDGHGGLHQGSHGSSGGEEQGGHGGYGGTDEAGHDESSQGGHQGNNQGGHGESNHGGYDGSNEDGYGGTSQEGHEGSVHNQHGASSESGHTGSYTTQGGYTTSAGVDYGAGGSRGSYTTSTQGGYTYNEPKYQTTSTIGHSPAPGLGIYTTADGYPGQSVTIAGGSGHQAGAGFTTIDAGVYTEIPPGGYGGHDATVHYGGQTKPAPTYEIEEVTSPIDSSGNHAGSSYRDGTSGTSSGVKTGSHSGYRGGSTAGSTAYHGNFGSPGYIGGGSTGSISSGSSGQGIIGTGDSTSGTVYSQGDVSGSIRGGSSEQGGIVTGITRPGYVQTQSGAAGYVVSNGVKHYYDGSVSKNTFTQGIGSDGSVVTGAPAPGVILAGHSSPGTHLTGQTSHGVIVGGAVTPGVSIGDSTSGNYYVRGSGGSVYNPAGASRGQSTFTSAPKTPYNYPNNPFVGQPSTPVILGGAVTSDGAFGYNTDGQYYTGGSGTSLYNGNSGSRGQTTYSRPSNIPNVPKNTFTRPNQDSGYKTNEYHDNGGRSTIRYNNGEVTHKFTEDDVRNHHNQFGTYPTFDVGSYKANNANQGIFTKTGPTKTGFITAQVGGSGSYVSGSTQPRPFPNPQNIGSNAFSGTSSKASNVVSPGTSTNAPRLSYAMEQTNYDGGSIGVSKVNAGSSTRGSSSGYSYARPEVQLNTFGIKGSTMASITLGEKNSGYPTTPAPFLDVHVYNGPSVVTSAPITARPAISNTYSYNKPATVEYDRTVYQSANLPSSSGAASTGFRSRPAANERGKFSAVSTTVAPIAYTTGPLENYKTTVFEAARIPVAISTVQPVIDTGYKTVVSPTTFSVGVNKNGVGFSQSTGYRNDLHSTNGNSALDVNIGLQQSGFDSRDKYDSGSNVATGGSIRPSGYSTDKSRRPSVTQSVTYQRPKVQQVTYESGGSSDLSQSNDYDDYSQTQTGGTFGQRVSQHVSVTPVVKYATPTVVIPPQIYDVPSSTIAPAIGVTYRQPFQIESTTSRQPPQFQKPFGGYNYSKPSVKFHTSTTPSISYKQESSYESETQKPFRTPSNPDIHRTQVVQLVTNNDRGNAKYIPSDYEAPRGDTSNRGYDQTSSNDDRYSGRQSYDSTKTSSAGKSPSGGYSRIYSTTPTYESKTDASRFGGRVEGSSGHEVSKSNLEINSNGASISSTTYSPASSSFSPGRKTSSSTRRPSSYSATSPAVTTYSGSYNRGSSTPSYVASGATAIGKPRGKVIVKYSDLHPLLLGKLGAECTCKSDPFAGFRGDKPLVIDSSRGKVDLRNYDESDVYVDLDASAENRDYDSGEYKIYSETSTSASREDDGYETPVVAVFNGVTPSTKKSSKFGSASSRYLPPATSTSSPTYLPPSSTYLPAVASSNRGKASLARNDAHVSASLTSVRGGFRVGKNLGDSTSPTKNSLAGQGAGFDRYGPGGLRSDDETLQGGSDCARPGLFRHPNFCNKFYACHWDEWKKKFTLHVFNCPVHLSFDSGAGACNWPSKGPACQDDNLLV